MRTRHHTTDDGIKALGESAVPFVEGKRVATCGWVHRHSQRPWHVPEVPGKTVSANSFNAPS